MKLKIFPSESEGIVAAPPSKSVAHRAIIAASLASGITHISNVAFSNDILTTIEACRELGAKIEAEESITPGNLTITGVNGIEGIKSDKGKIVNCWESGSSLRFLIPIFSLTGQETNFLGSARLMERPLGVFEDIWKKQGLSWLKSDDQLVIKGEISAGEYFIDGSVSSQFITGLLFTLPLLAGDSEIVITGKFESQSYIDLTLQILEQFGIFVKLETSQNPTSARFTIPGNQRFRATDLAIVGDYSNAAFFAVLGAINNAVTITGLDEKSKQGDKAFVQTLQDFGATITAKDDISEQKQTVTFAAANLVSSTIDLADVPDLGPVYCVLAAFSQEQTRIINAGRLRIKESDRIYAMETELQKCGVEIQSDEDSITITGGGIYWAEEELDSHNDHRVLMSLAIAATKFIEPTVIAGAEAVNKSYPDFLEDLAKLGVKYELISE